MRAISALVGAGLTLTWALLAGGCSSSQSGNTAYSQFLRLTRQSLAASFGNVRISREQAAAVPYASMGYSQNGGNEDMLVLGTETNGEQLWTSSRKVVIVIREGRIVRTLGLDYDLSGLTSQGNAVPPPAAAVRAAFSTSRLEDFPELGLFGVFVSCNARSAGRQTIKILGQPIATMRVNETCRSIKPEWHFTDNYWVDLDNGRVWRSRQHVNPKGGIIETQIFRPPA